MQSMAHTVHPDGMPSVGAALATQNHIRLVGQIIRNFPLAFVAPLRADDN